MKAGFFMDDKKATIEQLKNKVKIFIEKRDWEKFHSPKNLSMSLSIEAAELMELFQWLTTEESHKLHLNKYKREKIEEEIADIAVYLLDLCSILNIDLVSAINKKLLLNSKKYPVKLVRGKAYKYDELRSKKKR